MPRRPRPSIEEFPVTSSPASPRWSPAQRFALAFGVVYLLVGLAGFAVTGLHPFAGLHHHTLLVFAVNPLHNIVHVVLGAAWLAAAPRHRAARAVNLALGGVLGLVTVLGFVGVMGMLGMSGLADPDNFLHLATATLALYFGSAAAEANRTGAADAERTPIAG
jgi:Domain of unknown function (DUF4383)